MISGTLVILESSLALSLSLSLSLSLYIYIYIYIYMHRMQCILATLNFLTVGITLLSFSDPLSHSRG